MDLLQLVVVGQFSCLDSVTLEALCSAPLAVETRYICCCVPSLLWPGTLAAEVEPLF